MHLCKKISLVVFIGTFLISTGQLSGETRQTAGPTGSFFNCLAVDQNGDLLGGTVDGLFRFDSSSDQWHLVGLEHWYVENVHAAIDGTLFAVVVNFKDVLVSKVLVSEDLGTTWIEAVGFDDDRPTFFSTSPDGSSWAGSYSGKLFIWRPLESVWTLDEPFLEVVPETNGVHAMQSSSDGSLLTLVSTYTGSAVLRRDAGADEWDVGFTTSGSFNAMSAGPDGLVAIIGRTLVPNSRPQVFLSSDNGRTWSEMSCLESGNPPELCSSIYRFNALRFLPDGTLAVAMHGIGFQWNQLLVAPSVGEPWQLSARFPGYETILAIGVDGDLWLAGGGFVKRSRDSGASFQSASKNLVFTSIGAIKHVGDSLFAAAWHSGLQESQNLGETWNETEIWQANSISLGPDQEILVASDYGVHQSFDGGDSWQTVAGTAEEWTDDAVKNRDGTICFLRESFFVSCTSDDGTTWRRHDWSTGSDVYSIIAAPNGAFLVGGRENGTGVVYRSSDQGRNWQTIEVPMAAVHDLREDLHGRIFAGRSRGESAYSLDSGATWSIYEMGPEQGGPSFAFSHRWGIAVGGYSSLYHSIDYGQSWEQLGGMGFEPEFVGRHLFSSIDWRGVWVTEIPFHQAPTVLMDSPP